MTNATFGPPNPDDEILFPKTAAKLRAVLERHGLSQSAAARLVGVTQSNINRACRGFQGPSQRVTAGLILKLGVAYEDLVDLREIFEVESATNERRSKTRLATNRRKESKKTGRKSPSKTPPKG